MKFSIPYKSLIINLVIVTLILLEVFFLIPPSIAKVNGIRADIDEQFTDVNRQLALGQTTKKVAAELEKIRPFLKTLATIFLQRENQLDFITTLEEVAIKHDIQASIILPDIPTSNNAEEVFQIPLALSLQGGYANTIAFLVELQNLQYYVNIIDLSMSAQGQSSNSSIINTNLRANTYWKNQ